MKRKFNRIRLLAVALILFSLGMPGLTGAEDKGVTHYYFWNGTFYPYHVNSLEEYFDYTFLTKQDAFTQVNWKEINEIVTKRLAAKQDQETKSEATEPEKQPTENTQKPNQPNTNETNHANEQKKEQKQKTPTINQAEFEQKVIDLTNKERSKHGLAPLKLDKNLANVSRKKSLDMVQNNYFSHDSPSYGSPFDMMDNFGIHYYSAGENIAKGQRTPEEVVAAWMASEGHRANILHEDYTHIGVGFVQEGYYWTQQFIKRVDDAVRQTEFEQAVVDLTNEERAKKGLARLKIDKQLAKSARAKSIDMKEQHYFDHMSPTYGSPFDMMDTFGISYQTAGENIARGQFTPEEVVQAWMDSEGHRANILNPDYTHIGVGFDKAEVIWTQQFIGK